MACGFKSRQMRKDKNVIQSLSMVFIEISKLKGNESREERERQRKRERNGEREKRSKNRKSPTCPFRRAAGKGDGEWVELLS